jgi:hypothetical protein
MSGVVSPHTSRSVSATCAASARAGWQQVKINRRRSSGIVSWSPSTSRPGPSMWVPSGATSRGNLVSSVSRRRMALRAVRRATVVSQAPGRSGTPSRAQVRNACTYASCTASSAASMSRVRRTVAAST